MLLNIRITALLLALILAIGGLSSPAQAGPPAQAPPPPGFEATALIDQLKQDTKGAVRISYHAETGRVRFIGVDLGKTIPRPRDVGPSARPEEATLAFLDAYGELFGLQDPARELRVISNTATGRGQSFVRWQQVYRDTPVMGGELVVQMDADKNIISANGEILPGLDLDLKPAIAADTARQAALAQIARIYSLDTAELTAEPPELWIYNPALLGGPGPRISRLVWRTIVTAAEQGPIRELVLVDAQRGGVALHFNQIDTARNRQTYTANNDDDLPGALVCDETNPTCAGGDAHAMAAHRYAGQTYDFYWIHHGRDGFDGAGAAMISTVHYGTNFNNAGWDGFQVVYGDASGYPLADDVVAHEWTHAVTDNTSNLFYYYQSGAINESLSDIWGEFIDLTNGAGNDSATVRWKVGEDVSGLGAIRDMRNPGEFGDPDRVTSPNYWTLALDNGGVHINSGINNKAVYLLTDGGTFNGYTITGLGLNKAATIYYAAQTNTLVSGADYADLYDVLYQTCLGLVGTAGITANDCQEVRQATSAVEMNQQPAPGFNTDVSLCPADQAPSGVLFFDDLESGAGNWTFGALSGANRWQWDSPYGSYAHSGSHFLYADDAPDAPSDSYAAMNTGLTLPPHAYLHFAHAYGFEDPDWDGGVVEYSVNGGATWIDAGPLFNANGYDGMLNSANSLGSRSAFLRDSHGYISSRLNLSSLAGQNVRFRWRMGTDFNGYDMGWWLDDVRIVACPALSTGQAVYLPLVMKSPSGSSGIVNGNFESGPSGWIEYSSKGHNLIRQYPNFPGTVAPRSGSWAVWLGGDYDYVSYIRQTVTVPGSAPYLAYWHWIASEDVCGYDYGGVGIDGSWFDPYDLCSSMNTGGWVRHVTDLSAYAGQTINLDIVAVTDSSLNSNLFVDDVSFQTSVTTVSDSQVTRLHPDAPALGEGYNIVSQEASEAKEQKEAPEVSPEAQPIRTKR